MRRFNDIQRPKVCDDGRNAIRATNPPITTRTSDELIALVLPGFCPGIGSLCALCQPKNNSAAPNTRTATRIAIFTGTPSRERELYAHRIFTARAASSAMVDSDIRDCNIISTLAQRARTAVSVGENAVLVLNARKR